MWSYSIHLTTGWSRSCPDPSWGTSWTLAGRWSGSGWSSPWCSGGRGRWTWSLGYTDWILIIVGYNFTWPDLLSLWHTYLLISNIHYMANHIFYFYRFHGKMSMENSFPFAAQNLTATTAVSLPVSSLTPAVRYQIIFRLGLHRNTYDKTNN